MQNCGEEGIARNLILLYGTSGLAIVKTWSVGTKVGSLDLSLTVVVRVIKDYVRMRSDVRVRVRVERSVRLRVRGRVRVRVREVVRVK